MREYDFYVVRTEDGETRIYKSLEDAERLIEFYVSEGFGGSIDPQGYFFGDEI